MKFFGFIFFQYKLNWMTKLRSSLFQVTFLNRCQVGQDPQILLTWPKILGQVFIFKGGGRLDFKRSSKKVSIDDFRYHRLLLLTNSIYHFSRLHPPMLFHMLKTRYFTKSSKFIKSDFSASWRCLTNGKSRNL